MKKRLLPLLLALALCLGLAAPAMAADPYGPYTIQLSATPSGFKDVRADAFYADAVKWAVDKGITSGTGGGNFSPDATCTTAQILSFLWRANGSPEPKSQNPFSDVSSSDYYYKAALWAHENGLVSGNRFAPNSPCTRAMTVTYLWKLAGSPAPSNYTDSYGVQTVRGTLASGRPISIEFSAANLEDTAVTETLSNGALAESPEDETTLSVRATVITVLPGSRMTIHGTDKIGIAMTFLIFGNKTFYESFGVWTELFTGTIEENFAPYSREVALELRKIKDENGNPCILQIRSETAGPSGSFSDIPANAPYIQAVAWAVEQGITSGTGGGNFSPDATCTRGQIATFLYRALG